MKIKINQIVEREIEAQVGDTFKYGEYFFAKIISEKKVIIVFDGESIAIKGYITHNDWQPCEASLFNKAYARTFAEIMKLAPTEIKEVFNRTIWRLFANSSN
jgi:hypothetical protein